mgnify:CR=1 FL=1
MSVWLIIAIALVAMFVLFPLLVGIWAWYMNMWEKAICYLQGGGWWFWYDE